MVPLIDSWLRGTFTLSELFQPHDGHRIIIQKVVAIVSATLTHWDTRVENWVGYTFLLATAILIFRRYRVPIFHNPSWIAVATFISIVEVLFSLRQWENLLAAWAINPFASTFFVFLAIVQLERPDVIAFSIALAAAILASFSFSNGLLIWPIGAACLLLRPYVMRRYAYTAIWILTAAGISVLWLTGPPSPFPTQLSLETLERAVCLLGTLFSGDRNVLGSGSGVVPQIDLPGIIAYGSVLTAITGYSAWTWAKQWRQQRANLFPVAVLTYGLMSVSLIAVGHAGLGAAQVLSPRYSSTAGLVVIGVMLLLFELRGSESNQTRRGLITVLSIVLTTTITAANIPATISELEMGKFRLAVFNGWRSQILNYNTTSDVQLEAMHAPVPLIREWSAMMQADKISVFSDRGRDSN